MGRARWTQESWEQLVTVVGIHCSCRPRTGVSGPSVPLAGSAAGMGCVPFPDPCPPVRYLQPSGGVFPSLLNQPPPPGPVWERSERRTGLCPSTRSASSRGGRPGWSKCLVSTEDPGLLWGAVAAVELSRWPGLTTLFGSPGRNGSGRRPWGWSCWQRQATTRRCSACSRRLISTRRASSPTWTRALRSTCTAGPARRRPPCSGPWCPASLSTDSRARASRPRRCPRWPASSRGPHSLGEGPGSAGRGVPGSPAPCPGPTATRRKARSAGHSTPLYIPTSPFGASPRCVSRARPPSPATHPVPLRAPRGCGRPNPIHRPKPKPSQAGPGCTDRVQNVYEVIIYSCPPARDRDRGSVRLCPIPKRQAEAQGSSHPP